MRSIQHTVFLVLGAAMAVAGACNGDPGGQNPMHDPDPRTCGHALNARAVQVDLHYGWTDTRFCPYSVTDSGAQAPVGVWLDAADSATLNYYYVYYGANVTLAQYDKNQVLRRYNPNAGYFIQNSPIASHYLRAEINDYLVGGYGGSPLLDSIYLSFATAPDYNPAYILFEAPGNIVSHDYEYVDGNTSPIADVSYTYTVHPERDTISYLYTWKLDDQTQDGENNASFEWTPTTYDVGWHTLEVTVSTTAYEDTTHALELYVSDNCGGMACRIRPGGARPPSVGRQPAGLNTSKVPLARIRKRG